MDIERILIVCIGNVCRSPMAAALMRKMLEEEQTTHARVESAGIEALVGYPPAGHAQALLHEEGLDVSTHRARQLSPRMLSEADLVLVMDRGQRKVVRAMAPLARGKVFLLGEWTREEIPDPYGEDLCAFRRSLTLIRDAVSSWRGKIR